MENKCSEMPVAIFDLDGTILRGRVQQIFLEFLFKKRKISILFFLKLYYLFFLDKLGLLKAIAEKEEEYVQFLKGWSVRETLCNVEECFKENIIKLIYPQMLEIIGKHRVDGNELVLATGVVDFLANPMAKYLGINNIIATKLEIKDGKYTGRILGKVTYSFSKLVCVEDFLRKSALLFTHAYFYTDCVSDLELLRLVKIPVVINPRGRLYWIAKKERWKMYRWR